MITTLHKLLPVLCAGLLFILPCFGHSSDKRHDEMKIDPIALSEITFEFYTFDSAGRPVWESPKPKEPNTIPASARKLRLTAKVNNRPAGSTIRIKAVLQERCPSPDKGKNYLARLRHLTESDSASTTAETTDDEVRTIDANGKVTIEIPVHCDHCERARCGKECPEKDHLGEGPHLVTLTTTDQPAGDAQQAPTDHAAAAVKPSSFRLEIKSVCPKAKKPSAK